MNQEIKIYTESVSLDEVKQLADVTFGEFVKGVVDVEKRILGLGGELHADIEQLLLEQGSNQQDLWGINLHPYKELTEILEFDSMINIRPRQNNRSRGVDDPQLQNKIQDIINKFIK